MFSFVSVFVGKISQRIRTLRFKANSQSPRSPSEGSSRKQLKLSSRGPVQASTSTKTIPSRMTSGEEYKKNVAELQKEWEGPCGRNDIRLLLGVMRKNRLQWIRTIEDGKTSPILLNYPCFAQGDFQSEYPTILTESANLHLFLYSADSAVGYNPEKPQSAPLTPRSVRVFLAGDTFKCAYVLAGGEFIFTNTENAFNRLILRMAVYYVFDMSYPAIYSPLLCILQHWVLEDLYTKKKCSNWIKFSKVLNQATPPVSVVN
ncbi:uncharacterized protein LOC135469688 [Liolophura sinensis]|uniref:uncharacterized protein LOC135469688 n=1 Tax=Liolophura sinensis TaxID=3198878 RepID=UPI0031590770